MATASLRSAGVLLHPTSLPGPFSTGGIGDAHLFTQFLVAAGARWWQMLPICPAGAGNSPYQTDSCFAGDPRLIERDEPLTQIFAGFKPDAAFERFCGENGDWLEDHALYRALKARDPRPWNEWEPGIALRRPPALERARKELLREIEFHRFAQFIFDKRWAEFKAASAAKGIGLIGDVPIFVAHDSVEVWSNPSLFWLDERGHPTVVAGVPPDYFSKTGQLWGNVLYRWDKLAENGFKWWLRRLAINLRRFDRVRLDHFIGFRRYWEIPAGSTTAQTGRWVNAPGDALFSKAAEQLDLGRLIAEDLGLIGDDVRALRDRFEFPGMRVLQFAFDGGDDNEHLPAHHPRRCLVYTGTHDNDTTVGWFRSLHEEHKRRRILELAGCAPEDIQWGMMRMALESRADTAVIPMQDILGLPSEARMNTPGTTSGNWRWRMTRSQLDGAPATRFAQLVSRTARRNHG